WESGSAGWNSLGQLVTLTDNAQNLGTVSVVGALQLKSYESWLISNTPLNVPEPAAAGLLAVAGGAALLRRRRRRCRASAWALAFVAGAVVAGNAPVASAALYGDGQSKQALI